MCYMGDSEVACMSTKVLSPSEYTWPVTNYSTLGPAAVDAWKLIEQHYTPLGMPFAPTITVSWDSTPRVLPSDPFGKWGYPWTASYHSTPTEFEAALCGAKAYLDAVCSNGKQHCLRVARCKNMHTGGAGGLSRRVMMGSCVGCIACVLSYELRVLS
eukprot:m.588404 g.588404  ORF g.588404 m.588404 type:complete len:157 (-) comp22364_c0_seq5:1037-1507(-)